MVSLIDELHSNLLISVADIQNYAGIGKLNNSASRCYKRLTLKKKNGEQRTVYLPVAPIKTIQRYLCERYLSRIAISEASTAYAKGCSVKNNAMRHQSNSHFLFVDVKRFFESIRFDVLKKEITSDPAWKLDGEDTDLVLRLCSRNGIFEQGCVSSPMLANIYMKGVDSALASLASTLKNGIYTRYSDDITISSSERIPIKILLIW